MRILLTSVGKRVQLVEHLQENNYIVGVDMSDLAPARYFVDSFYLVGAYNSAGYVDELLRICQEEKVDMLIPLYEKEFFLLDSTREDFAKIGTNLLLSHREILEVCDDKYKTYKFMMENGIEAPESFLLSDLLEDVGKDSFKGNEKKLILESELKEKLAPPLIIKPRQGMGSQGVENIETYNDLERFMNNLLAQSLPFADGYSNKIAGEGKKDRGQGSKNEIKCVLDSYIVQEFCPGVEFTVDVLCDLQGEILSIVPRQRLEVRAGEVVKARSVKNNLITNATRDLVKKLNKEENIKAVGPLNIQCFLDGEELRFIEINPRFGGGVPLSFASGVNYSLLLQDIVRSYALGREDLSGAIDSSQARQLVNFDETTMLRYDQAVYTRLSEDGLLEVYRNKTDKSGFKDNCDLESKASQVDISGKENSRKEHADVCKIKGLIFDLDDTLYREWDYVFSGFNQVAKFLAQEYDLDQAEINDSILEIFHRDGRGRIFDSICEKYKIAADVSKLVEIYRDHEASLELYDDARTFLDETRGRYKLGIITDGKASVQWKKVRALGLEEIFDKIIVSDDKGLDNWKPNPGPYQDVLAELGLDPAETIYIGDNPHKDFITARKLGMHTIRVMRPVGDHMRTLLDEEHEADYIIRDLSQLEDIITLIDYKMRNKR